MDYQTPGVYIREVDSGPKPIASVSTSTPGFLGVFSFSPTNDAVGVTGAAGDRRITGKVAPALIDKSGAVTGDAATATTALTSALKLKRGNVVDVKKYLELHGAAKSGGSAPKFGKGDSKGKNKISWKEASMEIGSGVMDAQGKIVTDNDQKVEELLNAIDGTFSIEAAKPKSAADILGAYGFDFAGAEATALNNEYSVPPVAITNKAEFFRWLQSYFAEYLLTSDSVENLLGTSFDDPDAAADAVFEAIGTNDSLKTRFRAWLSEPTVFNFVAGINGFYDNGGGKCYVYMVGMGNPNGSIRENQADKVGLYAFDDVDDMAIHVGPGLTESQQREMLEHCETRKDRFAILDGPIVSDGGMAIPASAKGYGALYVPWVKVARPSWFDGDQSHIEVTGANRRKLQKCDKEELFVPPSGHMAGVYARVDSDRGVHKAPANEMMLGITGLSQNVNRIEQGQYNERGINVIRNFKDRGIRVWGARTLGTKSDPSWKYI
ncbi:MAG: phage tail sheath subtilisin-like domain-containing protein, partial [Myxococcota bacterium]|nr:phage tail sheath subtilisin-like domain-containing protein [Myxococcota bacterium]